MLSTFCARVACDSSMRRLLRLRTLDVRVEVGLRSLIARDALHVLRTSLLRLLHEALVVLLRRLLLVLRLGDAVLQLLRKHLHEGDDAVALAVLLLVRTPRLRRRRRRSGEKGSDARARDAAHRHRLLRVAGVRGARSHLNLLLLRELTASHFLMEVRAVELEQAVLGRLDELHSSAVLRLESQELTVLFLPLLGRLRHGLVQRLDVGLQGRNLLREILARRRHLLDGSLARRDRLLSAGLLRLALREVIVAELLLGIIIRLLLAQHFGHPVNHGNDLREVHGLRFQAVLDERQLGRVGALDGRQNVAGLEDHRLAGLLLEEAHRRLRERERLLEQVKSVIIVENLDSLTDGRNLLGPHLLTLSPLLLLRRAHRREVRNERLRVSHLLGSVLDLVGARSGRHGKLAAADSLRLNRLARSRDLSLLSRRHTVERLRRLLLLADSTAKGLVHPDDLARLAAVSTERVLALQHGQDLIALEVVHGRSRLHHALHTAHRTALRLDERLTHALLERSDRACHGIEVRLRLAGRLGEIRVLLLPDGRRLLQVGLRARAVRLVLNELLVQLALLRLVSLQLALQLRNALARRLDGLGHPISVAIAVAHELVERLLLNFTLRLDLLLHVLQGGHYFADRVGLRFGANSESCTAPTAEKQGREAEHTRLRLAADR